MNDLVKADRGTTAALSAAMREASKWLGSMVASVLVACAGPAVSDPSPASLTQVHARAIDVMAPTSRDVVRAASVRFLLLPTPYAQQAIATSGPRWSALSARSGELTISLTGTDVTHGAALTLAETQRAEPTRTVRGAPARILVNEGIRSVAWNEGGVDWSLEVECYRPTTDTHCTEDAFLLGLAEQLEEGGQ